MRFTVIIKVVQLVADEDLSVIDFEDGPIDGWTREYVIDAINEDMAIDKALTEFHSSIPIKVLDDYRIDTIVDKTKEAIHLRSSYCQKCKTGGHKEFMMILITTPSLSGPWKERWCRVCINKWLNGERE